MSKSKYQADELAKLAQEIMRHKRLYYAGKPEISDADYDRLEEKLQTLAPEHPALKFVGTDELVSSRKVHHHLPMLSLQKTYKVEELMQWADKEAVMGTWKVDGNSLSLIYEGGHLSLAKTRGNGRVGEEVTDKVRWVSDILPDIKQDLDFEVRGELYCSEHRFAELVEEMINLGLERPSNPRNIVAGLLGRKAHIHLMRFFNFFAFDVHSDEEDLDFATEVDKFKWLEKQGFHIPHAKLLKNQTAIQDFIDEVKEHHAEGEIGLDGAVFSYNRIDLHHEMGNTAHHPRFKISYKWQGQTARAKIMTITWATSRLGVVTPVAVIDPVNLSGANITNITLHNAEHVKAYNLKAGDEIELIRSGEVIPKFLEVTKAAKGNYEWPETCASCSSKLSYDGVRLRCPNQLLCPAQKSGTILNWIRSAEIDDISDKRLENMIEIGLVEDVPDLYRLKKDDFLKLPLVKEKMAQKLYDNIQKSRDISLPRFLNGLGIEGTGLTSWEKILEEFPSLKQVRKLTLEDLVAIPGFAEKSANQIVTGLAMRQELIDQLLKVGVKHRDYHAQAAAKEDGPLAGRSIAITGTLSRPRNELEAMIKAAGGHPSSAVSKNTFALVANDSKSTSSKMRKAKQLGIPIWSEDELQKQLRT
ncbi:MAG: NAD-dependent DNA ligase LigA [Oligoflexus sp.]